MSENQWSVLFLGDRKVILNKNQHIAHVFLWILKIFFVVFKKQKHINFRF